MSNFSNFSITEGLYCRNQLITTLYTDMDERAKKVADMDRSSRLNVVWDLAEEFKVKILTKCSYMGVSNFFQTLVLQL